MNVHTESKSYAEVRALITETSADVVGLVEVSDTWLKNLAPALTAYPDRLERPRDDNFGVALYSRIPMHGQIIYPGHLELPAAVGELQAPHATIVLVHPLPPMTVTAIDTARTELDAVADLARATDATMPTIVIADLNATPWSRAFLRFAARSGLCDTRAGFGVEASFPTSPAILRIPLDHAFASCSIGVRDRHIGPDVGSDHLPVIVDLAIPRAPSPAAPRRPASRGAGRTRPRAPGADLRRSPSP